MIRTPAVPKPPQIKAGRIMVRETPDAAVLELVHVTKRGQTISVELPAAKLENWGIRQLRAETFS